MELIEKSLEIALRAYSGKKDKAGEPYILHPLRLMAKMHTSKEMAVALLHDVIEDSEITAKELLENGIPQDVVDAVESLTKQPGETYIEFIERAKLNKLARKVKIADIEDNINLLRLKAVGQKDLDRVKKYHEAWGSLNESS